MNTFHPESSPRTSRPGSAIVWVIVLIVAIVIVVNFVNKAADPLSSLPKNENPASSEDIHPWQEESRLLMPGQKLAKSLSPEQPAVDEPILLTASVEEAARASGLSIAINPDGTVTGGYNADYNKGTTERMNYNMNGQFEGNFDPSNIYFDENGEDKSKLFFLAKGKMLIVAMNFTKETTAYNTQPIYVTGWINPDFTGEGRMVLMTGKKTFQTFHWKTVH